MDTESNNSMARPNIQIDDEVREMTEQEHVAYLATQADTPTMPTEPSDNATR